MSKIRIAAAATLLCAGFSAPAFAQNTVTTNSSAQQRATARSSAGEGSQRICVRAEITGSRMQRNICRTRAEWDRAGGLPTEER